MNYDLIVIGAGPGGYVAAIRAARLGLHTAVIERREAGGTCLNRGCIPTKTLLHTAQLYRELQSCGELGIPVGACSIDYPALDGRREAVVSRLRGGVEQLLKANGVDLLFGTGQISGPGTVLLEIGGDTRELTAGRILIATGSVPARPPIPGMELPGVMTSDELLSDSSREFRRLVIIGGGVIGVEFASVYSALGCEVTILEAMERLLPGMDREISQNLSMLLKKRGISLHTSARVERMEQMDGGLRVIYTEKEQEQAAEADGVLVAIGRRSNTQGLFCGGFSVEQDNGRILTDERFRTSVEGIWAIGDVTSRIQLAHLASAQGIAAVEDMAGRERSIDLSVVPSCVYTDPEIACVGITEAEAKAAGVPVKVGKFLLSGNGKSLIERQDRGFIKLVCGEKTGEVLGAQLMCGRATDLVSEFSSAIVHHLTAEDLASVIRPHPTFTEAVTEAAEDIEGMAVHIAPKRTRD